MSLQSLFLVVQIKEKGTTVTSIGGQPFIGLVHKLKTAKAEARQAD